MKDIFSKIEKSMGPIGEHSKASHGYFTFPKLEGDVGPHMNFRGKSLLNWSLNNYLGLANHPEVRQADTEGAAKFGLALPMGARMMSGNSDLHEELEKKKMRSFVISVTKQWYLLLIH
jgi:glycine C-acetyltransferase